MPTPPNDRASPLRLGLPKGRMQRGVLDLLGSAGIRVTMSERGYRPRVSLEGTEAKILKPQNIIEMLHAGSRDLGFAGADWVRELGYDTESPGGVVEVLDTGLDAVRLVAAAPRDMLDETGTLRPKPGNKIRIAAEMVRLTGEWIARAGIDAEIVRTYGATEVFPPEDADAVVDIAASGDTLRANGLHVFDELHRSTTRLYANAEALADPDRRDRIDQIVVLLRSVLEARDRAMLDMNVAHDALEAVVDALPAMRDPTVAPLRGDAGYAVRAAVPRAALTELIPALRARGATDLVVTTPTQIVR
ncbi:MAG: ATP phosphoribosyltransferase [Planctomycetota bacterium]